MNQNKHYLKFKNTWHGLPRYFINIQHVPIWSSEYSMHPYPWFPHLQNARSYGPYHKKFKVNDPICSQKINQIYPKNDKAKFNSHGYTYATKHKFNWKQPQMKDMLTSWRFHWGNNIMVNFKSIERTMLKTTCNTQGKSTCFNKTTKWKSARWIWKKKGQ